MDYANQEDAHGYSMLVPMEQIIHEQKQLVESLYWHGDNDKGLVAEQELSRLLNDYGRGINWYPLF